MKVDVEWTPPMRFEGLSQGQAQAVMEPRRDGAAQAGPSPMETVLMALCGCSGIDVVEILQKMRANLVDLLWGQGLAREQVERAVQLSLDKYCSVAAMLRSTADISYDIILEEA